MVCIYCMNVSYAQNSINNKENGDEIHLRNAYEISKHLYSVKKDVSHFSKTQQERIIGSIIWYADLQDINNSYDSLNKKLSKRYPALSKVFNILIKKMYVVDLFLDPNKTIDQSSWELVERKIRSELQTNRNIYLEKLNDVKKKTDSVNNLKDKFNVLNDEVNNNLQKLLQNHQRDTAGYSTFLLKKNSTKPGDSSYDQVIKDSSYFTFVIDDFEKKIKEEKAQLDNFKDSISRVEERLFELKIKTDSLEKKIRDFIQLNYYTLFEFIAKLNKGDVVVKIDNIADYSTALYNFSHHADYNIQTEIYEAESKKFSQLRLPNQSDIIESIAIYLANRIKQESVMWFFETISRNANRYDLIKLFFPTTMKLLQGNENYEIPNLGAQWRYSLSKDFMQMPRAVFSSDWVSSRYPSIVKYKDYLEGGCDIADIILKRFSFKEAIKTLYLSKSSTGLSISNDKFSFRDLISFLYAINNELFVPGNKNQFRLLTFEDLRNMNAEEIEIMLSLMDLKYHGIFTKLLKDMDTEFKLSPNVSAENIRQFLGSIQSVIRQMDIMSSQFINEQGKSENATKDVFYNTYNIWGTFNQLIKTLQKDGSKEYLNETLKSSVDAFEYVGQLFEIYNLLAKKNFAGAVLNTIALAENFYQKNDSDGEMKIYRVSEKGAVHLKTYKEISSFIKKVNSLTNDLKNQIEEKTKIEIEKKLAEIKDKWKNYQSDLEFIYNMETSEIEFSKTSSFAFSFFERDRHAIQIIKKLSSFLNDVALTQNENQLAKVVESYAMPTGSYKRKRNNWWSVDLNAFAGIYAGYENAIAQANDPLASGGIKKGAVWGFSAPIGISLSKTFGRKWKGSLKKDESIIQNPDRIKINGKGLVRSRTRSTITITGSIIDLGAIVSYRLLDSGDQPLGQEFKWAQFISPGLHLSWAIKSMPLVWNVGVQYTPQLRKFQEGGVVNDKQYNATRFYTGIFFDLPLFNLWERKHITSYK